MSIYAEMHEAAKKLTWRLDQAYKQTSNMYSFFCPLLTLDIYKHAILLQRIADCLENYPKSDEEKHEVLKAAYIYMVKKCKNTFPEYYLLDLLKHDLKIIEVKEISNQAIKDNYKQFGHFCDWVYGNREIKACAALYPAFPLGMRLTIDRELKAKPIAQQLPNLQPSVFSSWLSCLR